MRTFKINKNDLIVCKSEKTRNGFRHTANLMINGHDRGYAKVTYLNRTWERFQFQTVMRKLVTETNELSTRQKSAFLRRLDKIIY